MHGFSVALQFDNLWYAFLGCVVGTLVGVLPGIGPLSGISILLPVTFGLNATQAVIMLGGIYYGSQYGGSTTSILMRVPGEAPSGMNRLERHAGGEKRRAGASPVGDDLHRRQCDGEERPRRRRALHRRGRLIHRRHVQRDRADRGGAAARD